MVHVCNAAIRWKLTSVPDVQYMYVNGTMENLEHLFFRKENALFNFRNLNGYTVQTTILRKKTASEEIGQRT